MTSRGGRICFGSLATSCEQRAGARGRLAYQFRRGVLDFQTRNDAPSGRRSCTKFNSPFDAHILGVAEAQRESGLPVRLRFQGGFEQIEAFVNQLVRGC